MRRLRSWFLRFRWQKLLVVWLVFGLMAAAFSTPAPIFGSTCWILR